ncbi:unnamed protein product [Bursaphelenchus xylophilus]|uniref:(pine wood nematode) hypothetical protein n=1 Tax=Bursaphelenchus xylophilus TaxID=6326 RepID=A0A1I7SFZ3_BURXY|nr:unnamed protein product [Bursaphelenchus xylophilus]CAG9122079.1 unnamed protein product [Bursaphelenchus xylophilus]
MVVLPAHILLSILGTVSVFSEQTSAFDDDISYEETRYKRRERWREQHPQIRNGPYGRAFWCLSFPVTVVVVVVKLTSRL